VEKGPSRRQKSMKLVLEGNEAEGGKASSSVDGMFQGVDEETQGAATA
jgi:hypothetical protein